MRTRITAAVLAMSTVTIAAAQDARTSQAHQALFYRLSVPRQSMPDGNQKSVGGLTCTVKSKPGGTGGNLFNCVLADTHDAATIYEALNMQGKKTASAGSIVYSKTSGLLTCTRTESGQAVAHTCGWKAPDGPSVPKPPVEGTVATPPSAKAATPPTTPVLDPSGVYSGTYSCSQGETPLTLTLHNEGNDRLTAVFSFSIATRSGGPVETFSYRLQGRHNLTGDTRLTPANWESKRPSGYSMVGMSGRFDHQTGTFSGRITAPGCTTFSVTRDQTAGNPATPPSESRPASPKPTPTSPPAMQPKTPTPSVMEASPFAKDPRLNAVPPDLRELVVADADKAQPYCEANTSLSSFLDCGCVGQRVFDHRIASADYRLARTYTLFFANQDFMKTLKACVVPARVEAYARAYAAKMTSLSQAARECAVADFLAAFDKAPAPNMSVALKTLSNTMAACNVKHP
jgi:hypothetical protein